MDQPRERPASTDDEIDRTGRDQQVAGLGSAGRRPEPPAGLDDDDAPEGGVGSAEFPGAAAP